MIQQTVILEGIFKPEAIHSEAFKDYSKRSQLNIEQHGGVIRYKYSIKNNFAQRETPDFINVADFPSEKQTLEAFSSPEYSAIIEL